MELTPFVLTLMAGLSTGLGGILAVWMRPTPRMLAVSMGFAGGIMLTVSLADLAPQAIAYYAAYLPPLRCGAAVVLILLAGIGAAAFLSRALPDEAALAARCSGDASRAAVLRAALATGAALVLHNLPEGVLALFAGSADPEMGLRTALAVAMHNIPEGLALAAPLVSATGKRGKSAAAALASGLAEPLGAVAAWLLLRGVLTPGLVNGTVVLVAGVMLWVSLAQLLPQALKAGTAGAAGAAAGCLAMLLGIAALP